MGDFIFRFTLLALCAVVVIYAVYLEYKREVKEQRNEERRELARAKYREAMAKSEQEYLEEINRTLLAREGFTLDEAFGLESRQRDRKSNNSDHHEEERYYGKEA